MSVRPCDFSVLLFSIKNLQIPGSKLKLGFMILFQSLIPFTGLVCMLTRGWAGEDGCSVNGNRFPSYTYYHQTYNLETIFGVLYLGVHIQNTYIVCVLKVLWPGHFPSYTYHHQTFNLKTIFAICISFRYVPLNYYHHHHHCQGKASW